MAQDGEDEIVQQGDTIEEIENAIGVSDVIEVDGVEYTINEAFNLGVVCPENRPELFDEFCNRK